MEKPEEKRQSERGDDHKRRVLKLLDILQHQTDREHRLTTRELTSRLGLPETEPNMRNVRRDIKVLRESGFDVKTERHKAPEYYLGERLFGPGELQAVVDIILSCKAISEEKSDALISSVLSLVSDEEAHGIRKKIKLGNRVKTGNNEVLDNIAVISRAMDHSPRHAVSFRYFDVGPRGERIYRYGEERVEETPREITYMDGNYYLISYNSEKQPTVTRRVDRMDDVTDTGRRGASAREYEGFDLTDLERTQFGMFIGKPTRVTLRGGTRGISALYDRFGDGIIVRKTLDDGTVRVAVDVTPSPAFYGWARGLAGLVVVEGPEDVRERCYEPVTELDCA